MAEQSERGIHPDLLEETLAERAAAEEHAEAPPPERRRSRSRSAPPAEPSQLSPADVSSDGAEAADGSAPGEWWETAKAAGSPEEAFKLLAKNLPSEVLEKDERLSGLIGSRSELRARDILRKQEQDRLEQQKREAAANNDLYTLGELTQRDYHAQAQQAQNAGQLQPLMDVIARFQQTLPESVQHEVAGKTFGEGRPWNEGAVEYMAQLVESATKHRLAERESALRKSILSEINGTEPVPEREGGTPARVRVVTDEQIAAMPLAEYEALFDENGRPRPGVQHRSTRGIPIQRQ